MKCVVQKMGGGGFHDDMAFEPTGSCTNLLSVTQLKHCSETPHNGEHEEPLKMGTVRLFWGVLGGNEALQQVGGLHDVVALQHLTKPHTQHIGNLYLLFFVYVPCAENISLQFINF